MIYRLLILCLVFIGCQPKDSAKIEEEENKIENHVDYYDNGLKHMEGKLLGGKRHGKWIAYYESGIKWSEGSFRNGERAGRAIVYYENGKKKLEGQYKKGYKIGVWKVWEDDGTFVDSLDTGSLLSYQDSLNLELVK